MSLLKLLVFSDSIFKELSYRGCLCSLCLGSVLAGSPYTYRFTGHLWNDGKTLDVNEEKNMSKILPERFHHKQLKKKEERKKGPV